MKIHVVQCGLYADYRIESVWESAAKANARRDSLEAEGMHNTKVIEMETLDQVTDEYWTWCYVADIDYNFKEYYVNNILLDFPERITRIAIKKDELPEQPFKKELTKLGDNMNMRIISYKSREHCLELYKEELENIFIKFDMFKKERQSKKR